jgi:hypothetical protein
MTSTVIPRNSTPVSEGKPALIRQIGNELNADYVLDAAPGRQRWTCLAGAASSWCMGDCNSFIEQIGVDFNFWIRRTDRVEEVFEFALLDTLLAYEASLGDSPVLFAIPHIHLCH